MFCEPASPHAFTEDEARRVLTAGARAGLGLRVHGNQLSAGPGVRLAVELGAASVDHCTFLTDADVEALVGAAGTTVATLLPGVEFSTRSPYPDARRLVDAGVDVALATDCNPGTCNTASMPFVVALAVREMRMTAAEALVAATVGGARALRRERHRPRRRGCAGRPGRARGAVVRAPRLPAGHAARPRPRPLLTRREQRTRRAAIGPPACLSLEPSGSDRVVARSRRAGGRTTSRRTGAALRVAKVLAAPTARPVIAAYATAFARGALGLFGLISSPSVLAQMASMTLVAMIPATMAPPVPMIFHATAPMAMVGPPEGCGAAEREVA